MDSRESGRSLSDVKTDLRIGFFDKGTAAVCSGQQIKRSPAHAAA